MKTLFNYLSHIKDYSMWTDPDGKYLCVKETSWFDGIYYNPMVYYFYITTGDMNTLLTLDRYSFAKYMTEYK